jgi:hypothetical protein
MQFSVDDEVISFKMGWLITKLFNWVANVLYNNLSISINEIFEMQEKVFMYAGSYERVTSPSASLILSKSVQFMALSVILSS